MRIPSSFRRSGERDDQAMTPMIDMVFLLLVFFVCASIGHIRESLLPTEFAAGSLESTEAPPEPKPFGEVWLLLRQSDAGNTLVQVNRGGEEYEDLDRLTQTLAALAGTTTEIPVVLDVQPDVPLGEMIHVYDACRAAGFESINFAAEVDSAAKARPAS